MNIKLKFPRWLDNWYWQLLLVFIGWLGAKVIGGCFCQGLGEISGLPVAIAIILYATGLLLMRPRWIKIFGMILMMNTAWGLHHVYLSALAGQDEIRKIRFRMMSEGLPDPFVEYGSSVGNKNGGEVTSPQTTK